MALIQDDFLQCWIIPPGLEHVASILRPRRVAEWRPDEQKSSNNPTVAQNREIFIIIVGSSNSSWGQNPEKTYE
jgi:hypothetical protein